MSKSLLCVCASLNFAAPSFVLPVLANQGTLVVRVVHGTGTLLVRANHTLIGDSRVALIAVGRDGHHAAWRERFEEPTELTGPANHVKQMRHDRGTEACRAAYARPKLTVESVFDILKSVIGFRQLLLPGLDNVRHGWTLVGFAWNLKRQWNLKRLPVLRARGKIGQKRFAKMPRRPDSSPVCQA